MNLPLQMGSVFRGRLSASFISRSYVSVGRVLPATNACGYDSATGKPNKPCKCASSAKEYRCVGPSDDCQDCTP
jgi:hypothetical protein